MGRIAVVIRSRRRSRRPILPAMLSKTSCPPGNARLQPGRPREREPRGPGSCHAGAWRSRAADPRPPLRFRGGSYAAKRATRYGVRRQRAKPGDAALGWSGTRGGWRGRKRCRRPGRAARPGLCHRTPQAEDPATAPTVEVGLAWAGSSGPVGPAVRPGVQPGLQYSGGCAPAVKKRGRRGLAGAVPRRSASPDPSLRRRRPSSSPGSSLSGGRLRRRLRITRASEPRLTWNAEHPDSQGFRSARGRGTRGGRSFDTGETRKQA